MLRWSDEVNEFKRLVEAQNFWVFVALGTSHDRLGLWLSVLRLESWNQVLATTSERYI